MHACRQLDEQQSQLNLLSDRIKHVSTQLHVGQGRLTALDNRKQSLGEQSVLCLGTGSSRLPTTTATLHPLTPTSAPHPYPGPYPCATPATTVAASQQRYTQERGDAQPSAIQSLQASMRTVGDRMQRLAQSRDMPWL